MFSYFCYKISNNRSILEKIFSGDKDKKCAEVEEEPEQSEYEKRDLTTAEIKELEFNLHSR